jgi:hypothetical protein
MVPEFLFRDHFFASALAASRAIRALERFTF